MLKCQRTAVNDLQAGAALQSIQFGHVAQGLLDFLLVKVADKVDRDLRLGGPCLGAHQASLPPAPALHATIPALPPATSGRRPKAEQVYRRSSRWRRHGSRYGALAGVRSNSPSDPKVETIDAAIAKAMPGIFPMVGLGILAGKNTQTAYGTSAAGVGTPIAIQCRPEAAYQSLFGSIGATGNDFLDRKNLLDFVTKDVRRLQSRIAGPEKELVDFHLGALESLTNRDEQMAKLQEEGLLRRIAPELPNTPPKLMTEIEASQCDIAASALISGLTNVVTITSGVGWINTNYSGISNHKTHAIGHGQKDPATKLSGAEVLKCYRNYLTTQAARLLQKLQGHARGWAPRPTARRN